MSVPTTLQGTHDGCGGKVTFRPATHRRRLLAGERVALSAACASCGETLHTEWQLPSAAIVAHEARVAPAAEQQPLPVAAGAEDWDQGHAVPAPAAAAPAPAPTTERPVASLGDWRMRSRTEQSPAPTEDASAPVRRDVDPAMQAYLDRFSSRVEHAREHLRQASDGLPSAFDQGGGFRTPNFDRRPSLAPSVLSATPAALRPSAPAVESAVERAIASPTFLDDSAAPLAVPAPVAPMPQQLAPEPTPVLEPAPVLEAVPVAEPAPIVEPAPAPEPAPVVQPAPVVAAAPAELAPTDADVFPPVVVSPEPLGPPPTFAAGSAPPAPAPPPAQEPADAAADVWHNLPVKPVAPVAPLAAVAPAIPAPIAEPAPAAVAGPMPPAASFVAALDDAVEAGPPVGAAPVEAASAAAVVAVAAADAEPMQLHEPEVNAAGASLAEPEVDASIAFEPDRGFDWGPSDSPALPRRRRRGRRRTTEPADPAAGPEVVFEPAPDPDLVPARPRVRLGFAQLAIVMALAVVCGIAAFKVVSTERTGLEALPSDEPALAVPPAEGAEAPATDGAAADAAPGAGRAAGAAPPASPPATPGTPVADEPTAGTADATPPSDVPRAQVPTADADTPVVTASEASTPDSNPFARP